MPCRSLILIVASAVLGLAALAASPAAAYVSTWDSGIGQAWHDHSNGPGGGNSNWNGSPNNPPAEIVAGSVLVCPPGYILTPDHHWCWPH